MSKQLNLNTQKDGTRYFILSLSDDNYSLEFSSLKEAKKELKKLENN